MFNSRIVLLDVSSTVSQVSKSQDQLTEETLFRGSVYVFVVL